MLKIGTLCWVVSSACQPKYAYTIGMVAKIIGAPDTRNGREDYPTLINGEGDFITPRRELLPFSDPDNARPEHITRPVECVA